jgi:catalase
MNGYGSHTFKWTNAEGESFWVKYHFKTEQGVQNLRPEDAVRLAGVDPDYSTRDLYAAIEEKDFPVWRLYVQIMPLEDAATYRFDPFDVTKVWSHKDYPLIEVGKMVLDRNPKNYFAEVEQAAFSPGNFVPGIGPSPDKMLQGRLFAYSDAHRYRLGGNYQQLPINRPQNEVSNYGRDGVMRFGDNGGGSVNYEPNSFGGPNESPADAPAPFEVTGFADAVPYDHHDHYTQAGDLYRLLSDEEKERLVQNLIDALKPVKQDIQERQIDHFVKADAEYGARIAKGLGLTLKV